MDKRDNRRPFLYYKNIFTAKLKHDIYPENKCKIYSINELTDEEKVFNGIKCDARPSAKCKSGIHQ